MSQDQASVGTTDENIRILVVDDSEDDVFLLQHTLKKGGINFTLVHIETLEELDVHLHTQSWDIVISDHHLAGFSSTEVLEAVKHFNSDLPVIIVSGEIEEDKAIRAMHSGAEDFVMKDNLKRLIPAILREKKQHEVKKSRQQLESEYRFLKYHDNLTNLVNREEFESRLSAAMDSANGNRATHYLLFLDLDQFKVINDTCGHIAGDELLVKTSAILKSSLKERDTLARLGGDEFGIILQDCDKNDATITANNIRRAIKNHKFIWEGNLFHYTISIGMAEINEYTSDYHELLSCADIACYAAKDRGRDTLVCFTPIDEEYAKRRSEMQWAPRIKRAVEENKFVLFHQSMASLQQEMGPHSEFLVRMKDGDQITSPGAFIPAAERYNLMPMIDRWVICNVFAYLNRNGLHQQADATYFINLSGSTISDGEFFDDIRQFQQQYSIRPQIICFEITETAAIDNLVEAVEFISEARQLGFKFALDDFGVGLSSFSYLKTIPVDYLKIDGSFVQNLLENAIDRGIVQACNNIAHAAGLHTVAEFVENEQTHQALREMGIDFAQGYGIAKPEPIVEFTQKGS